jgi:hypothetical protein
LVEAGFTEPADLTPTEQRPVAHRLERFASRLITAGDQPLARVQEAKMQRFFGVALFIVCAISIVILFTAGIRRITKKPNLAAGKPWTASSEYATCHPDVGECAGVPTNVFFHTKSEDNPWFEYDFGAPLRFSSLTIVNRQDGVPERAVPLIVEVSNDKKTYSEVTRSTETFDTWRPKFAPQQARYLRLRIPRATFLHLEKVEVHP